MIEIICEKEKEKKEMPWRELPKNVRQIGDTKEKRKIYIEDFVVTYLTRLAKPDHAYARGAILLGDIYQTEEGIAVFIHGALEAQNLELDMDETIFNDKIWTELLDQREQYFSGQAVVGWFLSRIGFSVEMNQKIIKAHLKNFPGNHKVLYMMDSLENEDAFYICENQQMIRQRGYYIYYEKNSAMREYMVEEKGEEVRGFETDEQQEQIRRDKTVVRNYRRVNHYGRQNKKQSMQIRLTRMASMFVIAATLGYALYQMRGDQWIQGGMKNTVAETMAGLRSKLKVEEKVQTKGQVTTEVETGMDQAALNDRFSEEKVQDAKNQEEDQSKQTQKADKTMDLPEKEKAKETAAGVQGKPLYYTVQKGDTLAAISRKMYTTDKYASQIARVNDMANENEIFIGQKILIPSIE